MRKSEIIKSIYLQYVDDLYAYAMYLGYEQAVVMDAIHDVFYKFATDETILNRVENIKFYLFKSLRNRLNDIYRLKRNRVEMPVGDFENLPFAFSVNLDDQLITQEQQLQISQQINAMLNSLTARQREIVYLRYIQQYDYPRISELLHINIHSCRKLVSKAIQQLRSKFIAEE